MIWATICLSEDNWKINEALLDMFDDLEGQKNENHDNSNFCHVKNH